MGSVKRLTRLAVMAHFHHRMFEIPYSDILREQRVNAKQETVNNAARQGDDNRHERGQKAQRTFDRTRPRRIPNIQGA